MTFAEIKEIVNTNKPPKMPIYDYVAYYNAIVTDEERKLVCVSTDSYTFDKFYTKSELIEKLCTEMGATKGKITEIYNKIGGDKFDVPSIYVLIKREL